MKEFRLDNKISLITGGGRGIGLNIGKVLSELGARVVITGLKEEYLNNAVLEIGNNAIAYKSDVTKEEETIALVNKIENEIGPIDILVNNAGIHLKKWAVDTTKEDFLKVFNVHATGSFMMSRECAKRMESRGKGSIIFITSMSAIMGLPHTIAYTAAKSALQGMVRCLASELSPHGIRVNSIAPGWIETEMLRQSFIGDSNREKKIINRMPMSKIGTPRDVGFAAAFLASDASKYITGIDLRVDGGVSIGF